MDTSTDVNFLREKCEQDTCTVVADGSRRNRRANPDPAEYVVTLQEPIKLVYGYDILDATIPSTVYNIDDQTNCMSYWMTNGHISERLTSAMHAASHDSRNEFSKTMSLAAPLRAASSNAIPYLSRFVSGGTPGPGIINIGDVSSEDFWGFNGANLIPPTIKSVTQSAGVVGLSGALSIVGPSVYFIDCNQLAVNFPDDDASNDMLNALRCVSHESYHQRDIEGLLSAAQASNVDANLFVLTRNNSQLVGMRVPEIVLPASLPVDFIDKWNNGYTISNTQLSKYDPDGNVQWMISTPGIQEIAFDGFSSNVYVRHSSSVEKYDATGFLQWSSGITLASTTSIVIDSSAHVFVSGPTTVTKFNADGSSMGSMGSMETGFLVSRLAIDPMDTIYVAGISNNMTTHVCTAMSNDLSYKGLCTSRVQTSQTSQASHALLGLAANRNMVVMAGPTGEGDTYIEAFRPWDSSQRETIQVRIPKTWSNLSVGIDLNAPICYVYGDRSSATKFQLSGEEESLKLTQTGSEVPYMKRINQPADGVYLATNVETRLRAGFYTSPVDFVTWFNLIDTNLYASHDPLSSVLTFQSLPLLQSSQSQVPTIVKPFLNQFQAPILKRASNFFVYLPRTSMMNMIGLANTSQQLVFSDVCGNLSSTSVVNFGKISYVVLRCKEIEENVFREDVMGSSGIGIFKIIDVNNILNIRYDFVNFVRRPFHPISQLNKLSFRFENTDGSLCNFNGNPAVLVLGIKRYMPQAPGNFGTSYVLNPNYDPDYRSYAVRNMELQDMFTHTSRTSRMSGTIRTGPENRVQQLPSRDEFVREHNMHSRDPRRRLPIRQDIEDVSEDDNIDDDTHSYSTDGSLASSIWGPPTSRNLDFFH